MSCRSYMKYAQTVLLAFMFSACTFLETQTHGEAKIVIIKTQKIKFADLAYLNTREKSLDLELYMAGKVVTNFFIDESVVCVTSICTDKKKFNEEYLHSTYPENILYNIFLGRAIFGGKNTSKTQKGFQQSIQTQEIDVRYRVDARETYFKDTKNSILLKIKKIPQEKEKK